MYRERHVCIEKSVTTEITERYLTTERDTTLFMVVYNCVERVIIVLREVSEINEYDSIKKDMALLREV